ncbi:40S ribosomal protein S1-A [Pichia kudriavzevii]|uniref:Small ribosomal subunit protein eS1 n=1 Tax=Pichia kudriavzevii TaxID=4909 RepID=A0A1Z8JRX3_PICKU|nr:40S ribosomal protein S1-A [Pichia kudriavzevii]
MAIGKNKRLSKGKKGLKKKVVDPFTRKEWYDIKAPTTFEHRDAGKTLINKSTGLKNAVDGLKGRVFEFNLADLQGSEDHAHKKIKLRVDELKSLVRKWQSLVEANVTVKTADDYVLRVFAIAFTKRQANQVKRNTYAQSSKLREVRKKMIEIMTKEVSNSTLAQLTGKLIPEAIGNEIEKATQAILPLQNVHIRKVKLLKQPKFDLGNLLSLHGESSVDSKGKKVSSGFKDVILETV